MTQPLQSDNQAYKADELLPRFRKQLDRVEELINTSMRPLMRQKSLLSEKARRQALETLERWSELYRHGLAASAVIAERGEDWLHEAHQRLSLTVEELQKLDNKSEALATKIREDKADALQKAIEKIHDLIVPVAEQIKTPVTGIILNPLT